MTELANNAAPGTPPAPGVQEEQRLKGVSRSLMIGVGGTGHKILLDVRQRLIQRHGSLARLPIVSFLLLDTDQAIFGKNPDYSDAANLDNAEKIHASVYGVEKLRGTLRDYPHLRDWLDPRTLSGDIHQGAGAVRARGRLAYFWNYDTIARRIEESVTQITKDSSKAQAISNGLQVSEGVTVYIVGSLLGGTGSGMFLDLAYTVKHILSQQQMLETVGIFSIPPNSAAVAVDNRPNAYASLLELNHYTDSSTTFTAQYKADEPGISQADPPFRYTYLVDTSSPRAKLDSVDKLVEMIGHSVFLDLTSEFQRQKKSNRDNFDQFLTTPDDLGCPQNYLSMGLAALHFPKDKVIQACSSRLAKQIVARWTEPLQRVANIGAFTDQETGRLGLQPDEIQRQVLIANLESGELIRDTAMAFWNNVNRQYDTAYPGHNRVVDFLTAKQREQEAKLVDNDPSPDLLGKRRQNLGEYIFQMQENLRALVPAKEKALRSWVSERVNDPNHRHGVARAFLDQAADRFRGYSEALARQRDTTKETLVPLSEQRDLQLADITRFANDSILSFVMGAKKREIDERKENYLQLARRWDVALLEIRAAEAAIYFYQQMALVLETLKSEMDQYIERMRSLQAHFRKTEQDAIESPVDVNGAVIFDPGRREERDGGVTYVDGDIDRRYQVYVGDGMDPGNAIVNNASVDVLERLGSANNIYGTRDTDIARIREVLIERARSVFAPVEHESVLDKFFEKFGAGTDRSVEELRRVFALSQPFIHLQENAPNYKHNLNKEQTIVGIMHGAEGRTDAEQRFLTMLRDTVQGIRDGQISNANEEHQVLFLRERAAFPLRLLEGMDSYRYAYEQARAQGASANPIHTRKDVREWVRISPPSFEDQKGAWNTFAVGWATGVIEEERDTRFTATGARETLRFVANYSDRFGMPKSDPLGGFVAITGTLARLIIEAESELESANRPPREAREIILILSDHPDLKKQIDQRIEERLHEWGVAEMGNRLVMHAQAQQRSLPPAIYRPYQKAISDYLEEINYSGPGGGYAPVTAPTAAPATPVPPPPAPAAAPPVPAASIPAAPSKPTIRERLVELQSLLNDGLITEEDFASRKAAILAET